MTVTLTAPYVLGDEVEFETGPSAWTRATVTDRREVRGGAFGVRWEFDVETTDGKAAVVRTNDNGLNMTLGRRVRPAAPREDQ